MNAFVAALPMYDWPETGAETDRQWARLRDALRSAGLDAPEELTRRNADLPAASGAALPADGTAVAPAFETYLPKALDLPALWRHPRLLFAQACWGPMEFGLAPYVQVVGQPDYSEFDGGEGVFYSSVVLMRRGEGGAAAAHPGGGAAMLPVGKLRGRRLAYNSPDSMSGYLALERDLEAAGERMAIFPEAIETGGHRASIKAVAEGRADICAIDCRSWDMAKRYEPAAVSLVPVGWTARRKGLPYIASAALPKRAIDTVRAVIGAQGL
jgi:ABC-type phosphate/phosphonate transport system substrate-binding protein